jgi:hypothetical protein
MSHPVSVIPAKAGIHHRRFHALHFESVSAAEKWIPDFAGMTAVGSSQVIGD